MQVQTYEEINSEVQKKFPLATQTRTETPIKSPSTWSKTLGTYFIGNC